MEKPFTFSATNHRVVSNVADLNSSSTYIWPATGLLWGYSVFRYQRRFLRVDKNVGMAAFFLAASLPASYAYARFVFGSADADAAKINNDLEATLKAADDSVAE